MEVFILLRDRDQCKFPLGSVHILLVSILVSGSVNEPLHYIVPKVMVRMGMGPILSVNTNVTMDFMFDTDASLRSLRGHSV